jgi:hypothetical protein
MEKQLYQAKKPQLQLCTGNLLIKLGKLVFPDTKTDATTHDLQQRVSNASSDQLRKAGIPTKYWPYLHNISKVYCCFLMFVVC